MALSAEEQLNGAASSFIRIDPCTVRGDRRVSSFPDNGQNPTSSGHRLARTEAAGSARRTFGVAGT